MKSPEYSESFDPRFALFKSFIEQQQARLVAEADPRSEKTFDAVKELVFGPEHTDKSL